MRKPASRLPPATRFTHKSGKKLVGEMAQWKVAAHAPREVIPLKPSLIVWYEKDVVVCVTATRETHAGTRAQILHDMTCTEPHALQRAITRGELNAIFIPILFADATATGRNSTGNTSTYIILQSLLIRRTLCTFTRTGVLLREIDCVTRARTRACMLLVALSETETAAWRAHPVMPASITSRVAIITTYVVICVAQLGSMFMFSSRPHIIASFLNVPYPTSYGVRSPADAVQALRSCSACTEDATLVVLHTDLADALLLDMLQLACDNGFRVVLWGLKDGVAPPLAFGELPRDIFNTLCTVLPAVCLYTSPEDLGFSDAARIPDKPAVLDTIPIDSGLVRYPFHCFNPHPPSLATFIVVMTPAPFQKNGVTPARRVSWTEVVDDVCNDARQLHPSGRIALIELVQPGNPPADVTLQMMPGKRKWDATTRSFCVGKSSTPPILLSTQRGFVNVLPTCAEETVVLVRKPFAGVGAMLRATAAKTFGRLWLIVPNDVSIQSIINS